MHGCRDATSAHVAAYLLYHIIYLTFIFIIKSIFEKYSFIHKKIPERKSLSLEYWHVSFWRRLQWNKSRFYLNQKNIYTYIICKVTYCRIQFKHITYYNLNSLLIIQIPLLRQSTIYLVQKFHFLSMGKSDALCWA